MSSMKYGVGLLFAAGLGVTVACGGSSDGSTTSPTTTGGSGGTGTAGTGTAGNGTSGTGTGGGIGQGGSGQAGNGQAGFGQAGNGQAGNGQAGNGFGGFGQAGNGGAAGGAGKGGGGQAGAAGAGGNPTFCPAGAPMQGDMCTPPTGGPGTANNCRYEGAADCTCRTANMMSTWSCLTCEATEPMTGDMCTPPMGGGAIGGGGLNCTYANGDRCTCAAGFGMGAMPTWTCTTPPPPTLMCPGAMAQPKTGDACTAVGSCTYGNGNMTARCACDGAKFTCGMAGDPNAMCMAATGMQLATGDTCTNVGRCGGGVGLPGAPVCVCDGAMVTCN
ncbi:MAG TPA: hypothetical protein VGI10_26685 [Polyangiaceae bacterium]|jgi:hypothetical protein